MFYSLNENVTESVEDIMKNDEIVASPYEDFTEGAMAIVAESEENFSNLMEYIGMNEAAQFAETGEPVVYTEASFAEIKAKIRSFIDKVIEKIKALFKRIMLFIDQRTKSDKEFVRKYRKRIEAASTTDLEFSGYPFSKAGTVNISKVEGVIDTASTKEEREDAVNVITQAIAGCDRDEYKSKLFEILHGSDSKEDLSGSDLDLSIAMKCIENTDKGKTAAKKGYDDATKALNNIKKSAEKISMEKKSDKEKDVHTMKLYVIREACNFITIAYGAIITAIKDENAQSRALCAKAMVKSKTLTRESATIEHPAYEGFFDGFDMI